MASKNYNAGIKAIQDRTLDYASDTIKLMLLASDTPYTFDQDAANMTTAALSELSVSGYVAGFAGAGRATLASKTITNSNSLDQTIFAAANPAAWTLASGKTVTGAIVYKHITNDATSVPLAFLDFVDTATNGNTFTVTFDATGIVILQN